jgi:transglutaminase-like putative cysteine protease
MYVGNAMGRVALCACLWLAALISSFPAYAANAKPRLERPGAWVRINDVDYSAVVPRDQVSSGLYYLLSDTQIRISNKSRDMYRRLAMLVVNERGLTSAAQFESRFDPSYQALALHSINIHRGGQRIEKLKLDAVKLLQREKELEYQIYDGAISATVTLDDVRVGDVVEYEYTVSGYNPVFKDRQAGRFDLQWNVPVKQVYAALEVPIGRATRTLERNGAAKPRVTESSIARRFEWSTKDVSALSIDSDAPGWYDPYPSVEWTDYASWNDVAEWGRSLYVAKSEFPSLDPVVQKLQAEHKTPEARAIAALRFVQSEIRYLSVAIGSGSYAPSAPDVVLKRRFGDCKDKSLLLVAILSRLGVRATPALVHTASQRGVREMLPSPVAFNHVLVRVELPSRSLWMDPTQWLQGGTAETIIEPDYGVALLLAEKVDALTPMTASSAAARRAVRMIDATIDSRQGFDDPARYSVSTTYEGMAADSIRASFRSTSRDELQKQYRTFYDAYFPGLKPVGILTFEDDLNANRVVTSETYEITQFWTFSDTRKRREGVVRVPDLESLMRSPRSTVRSSPLAYTYPLELQQTTQVLLPDKWSIANETQTVSDPAFEFSRRIEYGTGSTLLLHDSFTSKTDEIAPSAVASYAANLAKARTVADLVLTRSGAGHDGGSTFFDRINWLVTMLSVCFVGGWLWLAVRTYRYDPPTQFGETNMLLSGLNGWLILIAIGLCVSPFKLAYGIWETMPSYALDSWLNMTSRTGDAYNPLWAPLLLAELACNLGLLVFSLLLVALFFKRRSSFPNVYIFYSIGAIVFLSADLAILHAIPSADQKVVTEMTHEVVRGAISFLIWSIYLKRSVRARSTFTKRSMRSAKTETVGNLSDVARQG